MYNAPVRYHTSGTISFTHESEHEDPYQKLIFLPVAEAGIPEERKVDALELGVAEVLPPPALHVLDPVHDDGPPQHVGQAQDVGLLQGRPGLARQAAIQSTHQLSVLPK